MIAFAMPTYDPLWHVYDSDRSNVEVRNALVGKYLAWLESLHAQMCAGHSIDRDSVLEAGWFALIRAVEKFTLGRVQFYSYANTCCRRAMRQAILLQKPHCTLQDDVCEADRPVNDPAAFAKRIAPLSIQERFIVTLRCLLDMPFAQIGLFTGCNEGAAKDTWHRAKTTLRCYADAE